MKYNLIAIDRARTGKFLRILENYNHPQGKISLEEDDGLDIIDECTYELYMFFMSVDGSEGGVDFYTKGDLIFFFNTSNDDILGALVPQTHYMYNSYFISEIVMDTIQRVNNRYRLELLVKLLLSLG
jgi:hypothetical protein